MVTRFKLLKQRINTILMTKASRKRSKRSLMELVNDQSRKEKKQTVVEGACQRPKPVGKEANGR
jgi:hypothetical protein